jgi:tetratricopeptide (TPR) repeat protein
LNIVFKSLARRLVIFLIILAACVACGSSDSEKAAEHYFAGTEFAAAGDWQEAIAEFDESVRLDPDAVDPHTTGAPSTPNLANSKKPSTTTTRPFASARRPQTFTTTGRLHTEP